MEHQEQKLLTATQVAERLAVHPRQVYRLKDAGKISPPFKLSNGNSCGSDFVEAMCIGYMARKPINGD